MKLLLALLLLPLSLLGQKIEVDKVDDFDGSRTISTSVEHIGKKDFLVISASILIDTTQKKDTLYALYFGVTTSRYTSMEFGSKIIFLFENGTKLEAINYATTSAFKGDVLSPFISLGAHEIATLLQNKVRKIRFDTQSENIDVDVLDKKSALIGDCLALVLKRVQP